MLRLCKALERSCIHQGVNTKTERADSSSPHHRPGEAELTSLLAFCGTSPPWSHAAEREWSGDLLTNTKENKNTHTALVSACETHVPTSEGSFSWSFLSDRPALAQTDLLQLFSWCPALQRGNHEPLQDLAILTAGHDGSPELSYFSASWVTGSASHYLFLRTRKWGWWGSVTL